MIWVYAISNQVNQEIYIGITKDLQRRLHEHNTGRNRYTKAFMPWKIIYTEEHADYASARAREKYFKSSAGKRLIRHKQMPA